MHSEEEKTSFSKAPALVTNEVYATGQSLLLIRHACRCVCTKAAKASRERGNEASP